MTNLTELITQWIGKKKVENVTSLIESEYEYQRRNNQCIGYNQALKDIKSKIPDLIEQIENLVEENLHKHCVYEVGVKTLLADYVPLTVPEHKHIGTIEEDIPVYTTEDETQTQI